MESLFQKLVWLIQDISKLSTQICQDGCRLLAMLLNRGHGDVSLANATLSIAVSIVRQYEKGNVIIDALELLETVLLWYIRRNGNIPKLKVKMSQWHKLECRDIDITLSEFPFRDIVIPFSLLRKSKDIALGYLHVVNTVIRFDISLITVEVCCIILALLKQEEDCNNRDKNSEILLDELRQTSSVLRSRGHAAFLLASNSDLFREAIKMDHDKELFHKKLQIELLYGAKLDGKKLAKETLRKRKAFGNETRRRKKNKPNDVECWKPCEFSSLEPKH